VARLLVPRHDGGRIRAAIDNAIGRVGVAPGAKLWSVRVFEGLTEGSDSDLICGIDWITKHSDQIKVANLSLGGPGADDGNCGYSEGGVLQDPVHAAICASVAKGITYVVSAGNDGVDAANISPANYDEVITVSAIADGDGQPGGLSGQLNCVPEEDDTFAFFSNYGSDVDVAALGSASARRILEASTQRTRAQATRPHWYPARRRSSSRTTGRHRRHRSKRP